MNNVESRIVGRRFETGFVLDDSGNVLVQRSANRHSPGVIRFTPEELSKLKGNVLTHNHPSGLTFGPEDISTGFGFGAKEIRAVGVDNTFIMRFDRSAANLPSNPVEASGFVNKQIGDVMQQLRTQVKSGQLQFPSGLSEAQLKAWRTNLTIERFAQRVPGITYEVRPTVLPPRR